MPENYKLLEGICSKYKQKENDSEQLRESGYLLTYYDKSGPTTGTTSSSKTMSAQIDKDGIDVFSFLVFSFLFLSYNK